MPWITEMPIKNVKLTQNNMNYTFEVTNKSTVNLSDSDVHLGTTPWFDAWRDCFLRISFTGDHEFLKNYLACKSMEKIPNWNDISSLTGVMVVSTSHLDPVDAFGKLDKEQTQQQQQVPAKLPKWFMPNIYKYYVLLHDVTEGEESK